MEFDSHRPFLRFDVHMLPCVSSNPLPSDLCVVCYGFAPTALFDLFRRSTYHNSWFLLAPRALPQLEISLLG